MRISYWLCLCVVFALPAAKWADASLIVMSEIEFFPLGDRSGGSFASAAICVAADGSLVAGRGTGAQGRETILWRPGDEIHPLGELPGGAYWSEPFAVSADGTVVLGNSTGANGTRLFEWTEGTAAIDVLFDPPPTSDGSAPFAYGYAASADASVVVGNWRPAAGVTEAMRWSSATGLIPLGDLPGGVRSSHADAVSADGSAVVGGSNSERGNEPFLWTEQDGMRPIRDPAVPDLNGRATGISADGSIVVGVGTSAQSDFTNEAVLWTTDGRMTRIGKVPGTDSSTPTDATADGSIVVGWSDERAFIWDAAHGIRDLQSVLADTYGLDLDGWTLTGAAAISDDGRSISGSGTNPSGQSEGWIATVPEPTGQALAALALLGLSAFRRQRGRSGNGIGWC